jgi:AraC-like DNA-binding protein
LAGHPRDEVHFFRQWRRTHDQGPRHSKCDGHRGSLQRRLAAAGFSYQQLLDLARRDAAARYLADSPLSIGEVAHLLGYSEPAAFNRAFRRWHHETPQAFRQRQRGEHLRVPVSAQPASV